MNNTVTKAYPESELGEGKEHYVNLKVWTVRQFLFEEGVIDNVEEYGMFTYEEACNYIKNVLQPKEVKEFGDYIGCYNLCIHEGDVEGDETFEIDGIEY